MMAARSDACEDLALAWAPPGDTIAPPRWSTGLGAGEERTVSHPAPATPRADLLIRVLDELDLGLLLVSVDARVCTVNRQALRECTVQRAMQLHDGLIQPRQERDRAPFARALIATVGGRRTMLCVGPDEERLSLAVVPVRDPLAAREAGLALLVFGKRRVCEPLSVEFFAREHRLTGAEESVLRKLSDGLSPGDIASRSGVALSTVRTQIASIRQKTGATTIGELVRRVTMLPPIVPILS
jgi:DNA-binding CsgD family transcriptional regulator